MKRLALFLPLLALAAAPAPAEPVLLELPENGCVRSGAGRVLEDKLSQLAPAHTEDPATNAPSDNLRLIVTEQAFAGERLTFQIEAWHCIDSTNGTVVSLFPWLAEDGCGDGSTAFTMPQRSVVFRAISNQADRVRLLHAPPVRIRTGDRADLFAPGFDLAASVVENRPGIGLALLRDASSARESGTFPTPGAQSDFMSYSDVTRCFAAPSAGEGSPLAFLFLTVSGPLAESAERFPLRHADAGEAAERIERMAEEDGRGDGDAIVVGGLGADGGGELLAFFFPEIAKPAEGESHAENAEGAETEPHAASVERTRTAKID